MPPKQLSNSPNRHPLWLGTTDHILITQISISENYSGFNQLKVRNEPSWEKTGLKDKKLFSMLSSAEAKTYNAHKYKNTIKEMFMGRINY